MKIQLFFPENTQKEALLNLKQHIAKSSIDGLSKVEIDREHPASNQLGLGIILGSITIIVKALNKPLTELVKCLQTYVNNFKTEIKVVFNDKKITISKGRSMKTEELNELVKSILNEFKD